MGIHLGIITTPAEAAQTVADEMVKAGIQAIWNFAPVRLKVPANTFVHNEDLYSSLASLSWKLAQRFRVPIQSELQEQIEEDNPDRGDRWRTRTRRKRLRRTGENVMDPDGPRADFIDEQEIEATLARSARPEAGRVRELLAKAREMRGLSMDEIACLSFVESPQLLAEICAAAKAIKEEIYGSRLVLFAPLYISNQCSNECTYCAFRASNAALTRRTLTQAEIAEETRILIRQGT